MNLGSMFYGSAMLLATTTAPSELMAPIPLAPPEDALANLAANGEQCNDLRGKLIAWQAWARSIGAAK